MIPDILARIVETKRHEVGELRRGTTFEKLYDVARNAPPTRGFLRALRAEKSPIALIAEVKKASPSKGVLRVDFDPVWIAERYVAAGATCLSVLTDRDYFQGDLAYLQAIRDVVQLPLLRKDFIIDPLQVCEARIAGADAILLIAACLPGNELRELYLLATSLGLDVLIEVHDAAEWDLVSSALPHAPLIGVNNRNLRTFEVSLAVTEELAPAILASGALLVSESGIFTPDDVTRVRTAGSRAILVGESLVKASDPAEATRALLAPSGGLVGSD